MSVATIPTPDIAGFEDTHRILRVRRFPRYRRDLLSLLAELHSTLASEHATGSLVVHYSQGSVAVCEFREETDLYPELC